MSELYVGLMSGTSMDGIDAVLCEFDDSRFVRVAHSQAGSYPTTLRAELLRLQRERSAITLDTLARLDNAVAQCFARVARALLKRARVSPAQVRGVGSHGQTVFHDPKGARSSLQLGNPSAIAAATGIATVADFRRADVARGGQGAPLVPAFHHAMFADAHEPRCVLNLGGIANVTVLPDAEASRVRGFDTGPASGLMDEWISARRGLPYDAGGRWAATGTTHDVLLKALSSEPYFRRKPPKSTGRDVFNTAWLRRRFPRVRTLHPRDVQRTLAELTVRSIANAIRAHAPRTRRLLACGGGVNNPLLMGGLALELPGMTVETTGTHGLDPQHVEAAAFAWLAMRTLNGLPGSLPAVTGATRAAVLGGIYRA